ncbi:MAG: SAM-dependent chlorinase/fluorinase [Thermoanaerobaculia bacterium]|nr:SAM-dependent chlorinase/fluorinase [Thermoanaerobaculia bacterium]
MTNRRSIVALLTDFGTSDPYVAAMKGVIASRTRADILDLSHEIHPFDAFEAGWFLRTMRKTFEGSSEILDRAVIVAVIDPGVGTSRRILAAHDGGSFFLAPDNGVLDLALSARASFVSVENETLFLPDGSNTFHGRDRFAPVAAALAERLVGLDDLGPVLERAELVTLGYDEPVWRESHVVGHVVAIDRFGNVVTDIDASRVDLAGPLRLEVGERTIRDLRTAYGEKPGNEPFLIVGSRGTIEISLNQESAADRLHCNRLDEVTLAWYTSDD